MSDFNCNKIRERFETYRKEIIEIQSAIALSNKLEEKSTSIGSVKAREIDVISSTELSARFEDLIIDAADIKMRMIKRMDALSDEKDALMNMIDLAPVRMHNELIYYYLNGESNRTVGAKTNKEPRALQKNRKKAFYIISKKLEVHNDKLSMD